MYVIKCCSQTCLPSLSGGMSLGQGWWEKQDVGLLFSSILGREVCETNDSSYLTTQRVDLCPCLLGSEGFTGRRCLCEVEVGQGCVQGLGVQEGEGYTDTCQWIRGGCMAQAGEYFPGLGGGQGLTLQCD